MTRPVVAIVGGILLALALGTAAQRLPAPEPAGIRVADLVVYYPQHPAPAERTAAEELARYLGAIVGRPVGIRPEGGWPGADSAIHVGRTRFAGKHGLDCDGEAPESWRLGSAGRHVVVCGGSPRGTLYAAYHLLEERLGVRWWTPFDESVPRDPEATLAALDLTGVPFFAYRDVNAVPGDRAFMARSRLNGHFANLSAAFGDAERYGPPRQVHNFFHYVPPDEFFDDRPEFFSEIGGLRTYERAQLCLSDPDLLDEVEGRMRQQILRGTEESRAQGLQPPRLYNFSQNDTGRPCSCDRCSRQYTEQGSRAATIVAFLNQLADRLGPGEPELLLDTLAYGYSFDAPRDLRVRDNVVIRLAPLYGRDFSKAIDAPEHALWRKALEEWAERTRHLRIWDYLVTFGDDGDLPLATLPLLSRNLRAYAEAGVEGVFLQLDPKVGSDFEDLKLWVTAKLLEQPHQDVDRLIELFTDGYYGAAGPALRRYLELLEAQQQAHPATILFASGGADFSYLTGEFLTRGQRLFDEAEERVAGDAELLLRVRHARLGLDRATLARRLREPSTIGEHDPGPALELEPVFRRYEETYRQLVRRRLQGQEAQDLLEQVESRISAWRRASAG